MSFDPITIASAAALAGGTMMSGMGRQQANRATTAAANAEGGRQRVFRDAAAGAWNKSMDALDKPKQEAGLKDAQKASTDYLAKNVTNFSAVPVDGVSRAPKVILDAYDNAAAAAGKEGLEYAGRTGALEGYGDQLFTRSLGIGRSRQDIDQYGNFSRGSMSVLPLEMEGAASRGRMLRGVGEIFSGLGNLGLLYGFTRPAVGATAPSPAGYPMIGGRPVSRIGTVIGGV